MPRSKAVVPAFEALHRRVYIAKIGLRLTRAWRQTAGP